ncbi:MAG: HAD-IIB family hydrolase [Mangrovibacterium sp.]
MNAIPISLVATDLDGTLLRNDKTVSRDDVDMLHELGRNQIIRVVATGRNYGKVREVIPEEVPFDYVAFSSGAGIFDCTTRRLLYARNIAQETVARLIVWMKEKGLNFFLFREVPENDYSWYYRGKNNCEEFDRYYESHRSVTEPLPQGVWNRGASQFLVLFRDAGQFLELKEELEIHFDELKILRASSPLETGYTWMEIFHREVSKGHALRFLCEHLNLPREATLGIGNDYNDLDMLDFTGYSYLVSNSPGELKERYLPAPGNEENAFSVCLRKHFVTLFFLILAYGCFGQTSLNPSDPLPEDPGLCGSLV